LLDHIVGFCDSRPEKCALPALCRQLQQEKAYNEREENPEPILKQNAHALLQIKRDRTRMRCATPVIIVTP
jgi:hypothetical protein